MPLLLGNGARVGPAQLAGGLPPDSLPPEMQERARLLRNQPAQTVGPRGLLYVQQREFAATTPKDGSVSILGSDDATTCHLVVLRHTGSGATCLTHCDGSDTEKEVLLITNAVRALSPNTEYGRLELHMIGGFSDDRHLSQQLTNQLLRAFHRLQDSIHLVTFCVTELNDRQEKGNHFPCIYGIAANVKTGEVFHASFPNKGPEEDLRSASTLTGAQNLSTSPLAEPPHFISHIRATLLFLKEHPFPDKTLFPSRKPWIYIKNEDGLWERISSDQI